MTGSHFRSAGAAFAAALFLLTPVAAAEFPTQAKDRPIAKRGAEPPKGLPSCDVGGVQGVMTPGGVCLKMSGFVSAEFGARQLK
jgi:hypothetical protein